MLLVCAGMYAKNAIIEGNISSLDTILKERRNHCEPNYELTDESLFERYKIFVLITYSLILHFQYNRLTQYIYWRQYPYISSLSTTIYDLVIFRQLCNGSKSISNISEGIPSLVFNLTILKISNSRLHPS